MTVWLRPLQGLIEVASVILVANQKNRPQQRQIGLSGAEISAIKPCPKLPSAATIDNQQNQRHQSAHKLFSSVRFVPTILLIFGSTANWPP
jgi:hypothetical protein